MIKTLLIANRGEIALRIVRAARELGIRSIVAHSSADAETLAVQLADDAIEIGPPQASKSYLNAEALIDAARQYQVDAIHPGYGFLSENADFADAVHRAGIIFVGPSGDIIRRMGDKAAARRTAKAAGVPVVPGSEGEVPSVEQACRLAEEIGYPIMIKASAGGGGRGIRIAGNREALMKQMPTAQTEARAAFGHGGVYLERFIPQARHIEVQILGDGEHVVHLFERECSLQRRRQKLIEESPSPALDEATRAELCESAVTLARHIGYSGAGTLEYLFDEHRREFFFIEMNTRIQVEHPVTEQITGIDLIREMLLIADGKPLSLQQSHIHRSGAAIELRLNAEDPDQDFRPSLGTIETLRWPSGPGIRIESGLYPGYRIPPFYDAMLAKLVIWDQDRPAALARARRALDELILEGVTTTASLHVRLLADPHVRDGNVHNQFLEQWLEHYQQEVSA
ncbi:acetyl-CoA carboxylase biotin carboxylase subunit [Phytohalomonas tamaricis]|uniref:acetyl-CoA carboxylase biotin carboxylase subunit n=1 Tax=Phytohalomonas tamaricis TaxID=2081032 RepID=UPI000D0B0D8E|nr:acetyl-CoA carboxylase biotin carboxylase subunit [Phytohalomonas tamaricis]